MNPTRTLLRQGFTLAEMILVVTILAILLGVSTPPLFSFMKQRDIQQEENTLQELRRALQAYLADRNQLPPVDVPITPDVEWAVALAGYTNLSAVQMALDEWGNPRAYLRLTDTTRSIQGAPVAVNYATFLSAGPDRQASDASGVAVLNQVFAEPTNTLWWSNQATLAQSVQQFGSLTLAGDDLMVKFTDYPEKLERYQLTLDRMDRIANAVESLARVNYSQAVTNCAGLPRDANGLTGTECDTPGAIERKLYYPIGLPANGDTITPGYYEELYTQNDTPADDQVRVSNNDTDTQRRDDMVKLMRLLGLPDEFCCSALETITVSGAPEPKPFYYFSNPRPRGISGGCGTRPGVNSQKLPARITTINNDSASPPTCG
ncbi:MAG: prepilin-type N-terminal cleavage/methylation domain-containing protein [Alphaproteobacteria bacterium]|nr:prepilin-type N-terminal cleavage/methylation domain-containing protein [Alphaproteobacteria bacterium]